MKAHPWLAIVVFAVPGLAIGGPCPFKDGQAETRDLWNATTQALQALQNAGKNCRDSQNQPVLAEPTAQLAQHFQTLVDNDDPKERELETQFGQTLERARSGLPIAGDAASRYGHCLSGRTEFAQVEQCLYLAYSVILNEHRNQRPNRVEREKTMANAIRGISSNLSLVASTMAVGSCRDDNTVKAAVGAAASITAALAVVPGAGLIGVGVVASLDAIQALINSLFGDRTLQRMLTQMNDRDTFENLACLQLEIQNQTLGCDRSLAKAPAVVTAPAPQASRVRRTVLAVPARALDEVRVPHPRFSSGMDTNLGDYLDILREDLEQEFQSLGDMPASELEASLPTEWKTLEELRKIKQARSQSPQDFEQIRKSSERLKEIFGKWEVAESRDWSFVTDESPFPIRALMDFHFRLMQERPAGSLLQNFDWWVRSDRSIRSMQESLGLSQKNRSDDAVNRLNVLHTNFITAMKPGFENRLELAHGTFRNNRSGLNGLAPVTDLLKLCTVGAGPFHFASSENARRVKSEGGTWSSNTLRHESSFENYCQKELACVLPPKPELLIRSSEIINPSTAGEADKIAANRNYVCALSAVYPEARRRLDEEFRQSGTVCGRSLTAGQTPRSSGSH